MSIVTLALFFVVTLAQIVFWENLGEMLGFAASVSVLGVCASLTLILAAHVAAAHTFGMGRSG